MRKAGRENEVSFGFAGPECTGRIRKIHSFNRQFSVRQGRNLARGQQSLHGCCCGVGAPADACGELRGMERTRGEQAQDRARVGRWASAGTAAGEAHVADAARHGGRAAEIALQHDAPALLIVRGVGEHPLEPFADEFLPQAIGLGSDVEVGFGEPFLVEEEDRRTVRGDVADEAQLPEAFQELLDALHGVAAPQGQLTFVDGAEVDEDAVVETQQRADEVVQLVALHAHLVEVVAADAEHHPCGVLLFVGEGHVAVLLEEFQRALHRAGVVAFACAEVVYVEQKRRFGAVADADAEVGADLRVDLLDLRYGGEFGLEAPDDPPFVVGRDEQHGVAAPAVAARTAGLLIVAFERVARGVVDHEPYVGFVDPHAEGVRSYHHAHLAREPLLLPCGAFRVGHAAVVGRGRDPLVAQEVGDLFRALARADIDDARTRDVVRDAQQLSVLVLRAADAVREVGPCEAAPQNVRLGETELPHDVFGHGLRRRGRERQHGNPLGQLLAQFGDAQVRGAEIVAPLRDAVGFVHGQQPHVHALHAQAECFGGEAFGSCVEELGVAVGAVVEGDVDLPRRQSRVDGRGGDALGPQAVRLILHEGDQGRNDDAEPGTCERRNLVGERFSAAGGHQRQRVAPVHHRTDDPLLHGAERVVAPVAFEQGVYVVRGFFHSDKDSESRAASQTGRGLARGAFCV